MARVKAVAVTFLPLGKSAHASVFAQAVKALLAPGEQLMGICLMAHIPNHLVPGKIKCQVHGHCQLHHTQVGSQMAAVYTDLLNQKLPDLLCQKVPLVFFQFFNVIYLIYLFQCHCFFLFLYFSLVISMVISSSRNGFFRSRDINVPRARLEISSTSFFACSSPSRVT